jgi:hypothetical protein
LRKRKEQEELARQQAQEAVEKLAALKVLQRTLKPTPSFGTQVLNFFGGLGRGALTTPIVVPKFIFQIGEPPPDA